MKRKKLQHMVKFTKSILLIALIINFFEQKIEAASLRGKIENIKLLLDDSSPLTFVVPSTNSCRTKWYVAKMGDSAVLNAGLEVRNTGAKPVYFQYYASFYDKDGNLIGCCSQGDSVEPNELIYCASCQLRLNKADFNKIYSYQITLYESPTQFDLSK